MMISWLFALTTFLPCNFAPAASWNVTPNHALLWEGKAYLPIGWRANASEQILRAIEGTGIKDVLLEVPPESNWNEIIESCEAKSFRYLWLDNRKAPRAPAFLIRPESYRITGAGPQGDYRIPVPNGRSVFYIVVSNQGDVAETHGWADVVDGYARIRYQLKVGGGEYTVLLYPRVEQSSLTDYWEKFDQRRDAFLAKLNQTKFGAGLRGFVNPLGQVEIWNAAEGYVPDSEIFRLQFEAYLKERYQNDIYRLIRAWKLDTAEIETFKQAARFVALFSSVRGVDKFLDPQTGSLFSCDPKTSGYWNDIKTVIDNAARNRMKRFAEAIRRIHNVPIIIEWNGWAAVYDTRDLAGDGLGMRAIGIALSPIEHYAGGACSTTLAWNHRSWLVATDLRVLENGKPYPDEQSLRSVILDTAELGAKGWYVKWTGGYEADWLKNILQEISRDETFLTRLPRALFYPENARHPATTMRLPGNVWWLPTPESGNRLELGENYEGYRHVAPFATYTVIWRTDTAAKVRLVMREPSKAKFSTPDGLPIESKIVKGLPELVIGTYPVVITGTEEVPVPQDAIDGALAEFQDLTNEAKRLGVDISDLKFFFTDAHRRIQENPPAAFEQMVANLRAIALRVRPLSWIEGESAEENNFGYVMTSAACSNGKALALDSAIPPTTEGFYATYRFNVPTERDVEIWLAARIPEDLRQFVSFEFGSENVFGIPDTAQSLYGTDFGWYRLGKITVRPGNHKIRIRLSPNAPSWKIAIDAIFLTPFSFKPSGPRMPFWLKG
ncbi:MAG TPA: hypothetical protein VNK96_05910 [Fimbriimonadales bacterium]|nr:hypothetical protein [Fimbriimonadales bacterium]